MSIYSDIKKNIHDGKKLFFLLIDPENIMADQIDGLFEEFGPAPADLILVGGSMVSRPVGPVIEKIKTSSSLPVLLFPGSLLQLSGKADGLLLLNLISGRNPEYLIGNHVTAAPLIKNLGLEVMPVGYILVGGSHSTSVEIISNTHPLPDRKPDIIMATALAGEFMGNRLIYLERGSGADAPVPADIVKRVREMISIPLIVGGGIKTIEQARKLYHAGADILVVGNAIETDPGFIAGMQELVAGIK